jgi:hypothetical protein
MSANPERGEVDFVVGERTYVLRPTMNALCAMERRTGRTYGALVASLTSLDFMALRELLFTLLQPYHRKDFPTLDQVGNLIDEVGGHRPVLEAITDVLTLNAARAKAERDADPQTAQVGTGEHSGAPLAASA